MVDRIGTLDMAIQKAGGRSGFQAGETVLTQETAEAFLAKLPNVEIEVDGHWTGTCDPLCDDCAEVLRQGDDTDARRRRNRLNQLTSP